MCIQIKSFGPDDLVGQYASFPMPNARYDDDDDDERPMRHRVRSLGGL